MHKHLLLRVMAVAFLALPMTAAAQSFSDVPKTNPAYDAVEYLKSKGIVQGSNGKFSPNDKVTKAQVAKILVAAMVKPEEAAAVTATSFTNIAPGDWRLPWVELASKRFGIIDGPPKTMQFTDKNVSKAEFLKMALASKKMNGPSMYAEFGGALAKDVAGDQWFHPWMRLAMATSMTTAGDDGLLNPTKEITRDEMAILFYRLEMYLQNRRSQALLSETEKQIVYTLQFLGEKRIDEAEFASVRALVMARGALTARPNENIVKGAVKTAEGFNFLVLGYRAGVAGDFTKVIQLAKDAYASADKAEQFAPSLQPIAAQMRDIAKKMAEEARAQQAQ